MGERLAIIKLDRHNAYRVNNSNFNNRKNPMAGMLRERAARGAANDTRELRSRNLKEEKQKADSVRSAK